MNPHPYIFFTLIVIKGDFLGGRNNKVIVNCGGKIQPYSVVVGQRGNKNIVVFFHACNLFSEGLVVV